MALWFRARVINQQEDWVALEAIGQQLLQNEKGREWVGVYHMCGWAAQNRKPGSGSWIIYSNCSSL